MSLIIHELLKLDWSQILTKFPLNWELSHEDKRLVFRASRNLKGVPHPEAREDKFLPELWRYEVAELFLRDTLTGHYFEFNLSPNGGWWACRFEAPRLPSDSQPDFTQIVASAEAGPDCWEAQLSIPCDLFSSMNSLEYNVTAILGTEPQRFYSQAQLPGQEPDFHQPDAFLPLQISEDS